MAKAIAFFGLQFEAENCSLVEKLIHRAEELGFEALVEEKYLEQLGQCQLSKTVKSFSAQDDLHADVELMISLGGDGTILRAVTYIGHKNIPLVGINTGRLGFCRSCLLLTLKRYLTALYPVITALKSGSYCSLI